MNVKRLTSPLPPGSTIGIFGGGQLGRMLAMAAAHLGFQCRIYTDRADAPAAAVAPATVAEYTDVAALRAFAARTDVITYEFENIPVEATRALAEAVPLAPSARSLEISQDRLTEKSFIRDLAIPVARFADIAGPQDIAATLRTWVAPAILKTRRLGYDGKGQYSLKDPAEAATAWQALGCAPAILEARVPFAREMSVIVARDWRGNSVAYDIPVNEHGDGILRRSTVTSGQVADDITAHAQAIAAKIACALDHVGVLAVELFDLGPTVGAPNQRLLVNEIAPRVHNSGHWTMDACCCDQFENHIRAVAGWSLGGTRRHSDVEMTNLIGGDVENWPRHAACTDTSLYLYGKGEARPGRKMGHVNRILTTGRDVGR